MIIQLEDNLAANYKENILTLLSQQGYTTTEVTTQAGSYLVGIGKNTTDIRKIGALPGIVDIHVVSDGYQLVSGKWKLHETEVPVNGNVIGNGHFMLMAGPCAIETPEQVHAIAKHLVENNIKIMRGGIFKPRSSPYSFQGLGMEGLKMFYTICREYGLSIISEVMEVDQIEKMHDYIDIFQVGARNSQNFNLLHALGKVDKPVLLKRGISGSIDELLQSAEYIFSSGNEKLMLCERGIRTYENASRNTFDINAIPILKEKTHLPVIADPSHGIGIRRHVSSIALAAAIAGADGVIYEVHEKPEEAYSDGQQTLNFDESAEMATKINNLKSYLSTARNSL